ncbi:hypothetical protein DSO57_1039047 [Entomophthora muscae]|uniref:Uncharacterized protein n=1 Tax=Entomophthora muscae TaxID=34485 RepID=A0ACC2S0M6_9FUNG|nr:hypothetical protein DSO57_1039047 [Entomophthora muscae]
MDASLSSHPSPALDGVLVNPSPRMGAKLKVSSSKETCPDSSVMLKDIPTPPDLPITPESAPKRTSWLLTSMLLMGLNVYLLQLSPVASLWTPV